MTTVGKWNFQTHEYDPYELPAGNVPLLADLDEHVNCANCGKDLVFGDCYTSRRIHNKYGLGYPVCEDCYSEEWALEKEAKNA